MFDQKRIMADFAQLEKRYDAAFENNLKRVNGIDLHILSAAQMFGVMYSNVTKDQREAAKSRNFGLIYGDKADTLVPTAESLAKVFTPDELVERCQNYGVANAEQLAQSMRVDYQSHRSRQRGEGGIPPYKSEVKDFPK